MTDNPTFDGDSSNNPQGPSWFTRVYGAPVFEYYGPPLRFEADGKMAAEFTRMMREQTQNGNAVKFAHENIQRVFTSRIEEYRSRQAQHDPLAEETMTRFEAIEDIIQALEWLQSDFAATAQLKDGA